MRVAVLGAGYAGVTLARTLQGSLPEEASLVVVDESDRHLLQHELHRVIRRPSLAEEVAIPLEELLDCEVRRATVEDVDPDAGEVRLAGDETLSYDVGAVCLGAATDYQDVPGVAEHATPLKRLDHAREIRRDYEDVLSDDGRVVVGGAGLSGVQVAGELAAMAREADAEPDVVLVERLDSVAPGFPTDFQSAVREALEERGVTVRTDAPVARADAAAIELAEGESLAYDQFVWTGGIRGSDALAGDRPAVRSDLRLTGDTFVLGDAARVVDDEGQAVPASAQAAVREARVAAANVRKLVAHRLDDGDGFAPRFDRYTFDAPGWLVSVGDGAVAQVGSRVLTGRAALALKTSVGAGYLGSVGAVANAVDLVREELGLGDGDGETGSDGVAEEAEDGAADGTADADRAVDADGTESSDGEGD